jgi:uncharacterized membrane protein YdcZ (DUF606 family)
MHSRTEMIVNAVLLLLLLVFEQVCMALVIDVLELFGLNVYFYFFY